MKSLLRRLALVLVLAAIAAPVAFYFLPAPQKVRVLIRTVDVAQRLLRRTVFRLDYQPLFRRIEELGQVGMRACCDGLDASGEANAVAVYRDRLKPAPSDRLVFVDGGAFEGEYTDVLRAAFKDFPNAEIHAFEPAAVFEVLRQREASDSRVHVNRVALGDAPGQLTLFLQAEPKTNTLVAASRTTDQTESVEVTTLDAYASAHGIDRIDILKLDIEGFELNALRGAAGLLRDRRVRIVQFEYGWFSHANHVTFEEIVATLGTPAGLFRMVGDGLEPLEKAGNSVPNVLPGNYVAFLR